ADLFRYAGRASFRDHLVQVFLAPGYRYTWWMRFCAFLSTSKLGWLLFPLAWLINRHQQIRFGIGISYKTQVGPGLYIGHEGGIVVSELAIIGKNCNLSHQVTIGVSRRGERAGIPTVGDNVYIGPGAKIFGQVHIGNNAAIGANCVVTHDVPESGVVVGVPGRVISYEGSKGYINKSNYEEQETWMDKWT
ncbi:MAG: serine acetyltransferase, partial [Anaerolineaceae bacterium]|nr:serine acetyltransferase [Anaerolineaceae bacterium]